MGSSGVSYTFYVNGQPVEAAAVSGSVFNSASTTLNLDQLSAASPTTIGLKITTPSGCSSTDSVTLYINKLSGEDKIITTTVSYCSNADPAIILTNGSSSPV